MQTVIMLFLAYRVHESFGPERPWWVQPERRAVPVLARYATWRYSTRGQEGLREMLHGIACRSAAPTGFLTTTGMS